MRKNTHAAPGNPMFGWIKRLFPGPAAAADQRGATGERLAAEYLRRERGCTVVARNWRAPRDRRAELDLVCRDGEVLVFVEVKTRTAGALVPGYFAVGPRKKRALRRACAAYLGSLAVRPNTFRFDVVEVTLPASAAPDGGSPAVNHFENIPLFSRRDRG